MHLWELFWQLSARRQQGMNGPQPLTYPDIAYYSALTGNLILREEVAILMQMDIAYLRAVAEEHKAQMERAKSKSEKK